MRIPRLLLFSWVLSLAVLHADDARAELWQGALTHPKDEMAFGGYAQVYGASFALPSAFMAFGQFTYGLKDRVQLEARLGFGMYNLYVGFFGKYRIWRNEHFALAFLGGGLYQVNFALNADLIGSYSAGPFEIYLAPLVGVPVQVGLIPGIDYRISKSLKIYLEFDANISGYYNAGSLGIRDFF